MGGIRAPRRGAAPFFGAGSRGWRGADPRSVPLTPGYPPPAFQAVRPVRAPCRTDSKGIEIRRGGAVAFGKPNGLVERSPELARSAYPGEREREESATPRGLPSRALGEPEPERSNGSCATLTGLGVPSPSLTQGSRRAATLGFGPQPLRGCHGRGGRQRINAEARRNGGTERRRGNRERWGLFSSQGPAGTARK